MTAPTETAVTTQVYRVYIKASPQRDLGRDHRPRVDRAVRLHEPGRLRPATGRCVPVVPERADEARSGGDGDPLPDVVVDGEVIEVDPPHRLVQTWRMLMDPDTADEGFTRISFEIAEGQGGVSKLTVTHELEGAPKLALIVGGQAEETGAGGGWAWVLSDLKSLLETGAPMDLEDGLKQ